MMQTALAIVIVLAAAGYLLWLWLPRRKEPTASRGGQSGAHAACHGCSNCSTC